MLKITEIELELISNIDVYLFSEKSMRKEVPSLARRFSKANNKYIQSYDSNKKSKYILYLD